ncbi:hypothetical protein M3Y95_00831300 [Aphelenchoides besseyi]|nr:hypothetical protein M3Y95_00831300 [Aphelenchoides besseyi]
MTSLQHTKPKLTPEATAAFFRHFINVKETKSLSKEKRTFRVMMVSNNFCRAAQKVFCISKVTAYMNSANSKEPNDWTLEGFSGAILNEPTALVVLKLTVPKITSFVAYQFKKTAKKINPAIMPYLAGISNYIIQNNVYPPKYSMELLKKLSSSGKLKKLECEPRLLVGLKPLSIDQYFTSFTIDDAPIDMDTILRHKFRQIHLQMMPLRLQNEIYGPPQSTMVSFNNSDVVQPSIEEIYLENKVDQRFQSPPSLLPLNFYQHVPNSKKVFYSAHQTALKPRDSSRTSELYKLVNYIYQLFKHVKQALQRGSKAQFVFALSTRAFLNKNQSDKEWFNELARSSVFVDTKCQVLSELEMSKDPDFQATPAYRELKCQDENTAMICCGQNVKLFLWAAFERYSQ